MSNGPETIGGAGAVAMRRDDGVAIGPGNVASSAVSEGAAILSMIERAARDPAVDINKMERLFQMQQEASARRARSEYLAAFSALQSGLPSVARRGISHNGKYARFEDVIEAVRGHMSQHGFSLSFRVERRDGAIDVTGVLGHAGGHSEQTTLPLPADKSVQKNEVQMWGSAISYGKRYVALMLLGIATEDDDDGKAAGHVAADLPTIDKLKTMIAETKADAGKICEHFSVETLNDLTVKQIGDVIAGLAARKRQQVKP